MIEIDVYMKSFRVVDVYVRGFRTIDVYVYARVVQGGEDA